MINKLTIALFAAIMMLFASVFCLSAQTAGDRGYGLTVFSGTEVSTFEVELLGEMENSRMNDEIRVSGKSWLIRVSGEEVEKHGGISRGMSGSPIYVDGKLIGGLASSWRLTPHRVGLMIPIAEMRRLYKLEKTRGCREKKRSKERLLSTPLFVSGLNSVNLSRLRNSLENKGYSLMTGPAPTVENQAIEMKAGSAIALMMARGDINISTLGTMTEVRRDGSFLALAHPFMKRGDVAYFLSAAQILHTFQSPESPFKVGAPLYPCGAVLQDRNQGVMGKLGQNPRVLHLSVTVQDNYENQRGKLQCDLINDSFLVPEILTTAVMQALDSVANREVDQTMKVEIDTYLNAANGDQFTFSRKNHGGFNDPRAFLESEITHVVSGIFTNPHMELQPYDFTVRISIDATRSFQTISAIKVVNDHLVKGEDFTLQLTCQKFRQANQVQNVTMQLPGNLPDGEYEIVVTAGGSAPQTNSIFALEQAGRPKESTLATWLDRLANDNRQDQIRCLFRPVEPKEIVTTKKRNIPTRLADHGKFLEKLAKKVDERRIDAEAMIVMTLPVSSPTSGEQSLRVRFGAASEELDQISSVEEDEEQI